LIAIGAVLQGVSGLAMLALVLAFPDTPHAITGPMIFYASGVGFTLPASMAGAMMPFPDRAGSASSLISILQMGVAAILGALVGAFIDLGPLVLAGAIAGCGLCALAIAPLIRQAANA
jgi:MFS transporter, DHA1 family, multidrug resistance protein